jgi:hypothetical protein
MLAVLEIVLVFAAFRLPPGPRLAHNRAAPNPWLVGIVSFAASGVARWLPRDWPAPALVLAIVMLGIGAVAVVWYWSGSQNWSGPHRLALAGGALLTNAWSGFPHTPVFPVSESVDLFGNAVFALAAVVLVCVIALRLRASTREPMDPSPSAFDPHASTSS